MRLTIKRGVGRYSVLIVGLGAAGVAIGWLCHDTVPMVRPVRLLRAPAVH